MKSPLSLTALSLLALCAGLAAVLAHEVARTAPRLSSARPAPAVAAAEEQAIAPAVFTAPPAQKFTEITARPLFVVARRPAPPAPPPAAAPPPPPPAPPAPPVAASSITVLGIITDHDKRMALLQPPNSSVVLTVMEGGSIAGWHVSRILSNRVVLQWNSTEQEITFPKLADRPGGAAPGAMQGTLTARPPTTLSAPRNR